MIQRNTKKARLLKVLTLVLSLVLAFSTVSNVFAATKPTIAISSASANPGDTITLSVSIANNPGINSFTLGFSYDTSKLQLEDVIVEKSLGGQFVYKKKAVWLANKDTKYNGEILYLKFKVLDEAANSETKVSVTYSPGDIVNYAEKDVNPTVAAGTVTVGIAQMSVWARIVAIFRNLLMRIMSFFKRS